MNKFRTLRADEIECRIATVKSTGLSLLLYKDARCDMNILDEVVGEENWKREHSRDNANCTVSIWDSEKKQWISKEDTGTESYTEKEKGLASDSFKRACVNWGIGRELYTAPSIWVSANDCKITESNVAGKAKYTCSDRFYVSEIVYDESRCIQALQIKHKKSKKVVFELGKVENAEPETPGKKENHSVIEAKRRTIRAICEKHRIDVKALYSSNGISEEDCTEEQADNLIRSLKRKFGEE